MPIYPAPENLLLRAAGRTKPAAAAKLEHVVFEPGQQLWRAGDAGPYALFPLRGAVSLQIAPATGKHVEIAIVGREGFAGVALPLGEGQTRSNAVALSAGEAFILPRELFRRWLANRQFRCAIERYTDLFIAMLSNTLACSRVHVLEKLCVCRLLQIQDRTHNDTLQLTQDTFARHLGVRRASVSRAVAGLQKLGAITYDRRGRVTISDRRQLERLACGCYHRLKSEFDQLVDEQGGV
jgi:CRP-like cAMP-binding protein